MVHGFPILNKSSLGMEDFAHMTAVADTLDTTF